MGFFYGLFLQLLYSLVLLIVTGYTFYIFKYLLYRNSRSAYSVLRLTGYIGIPIHEIAHASLGLLFGHKIREAKLYQNDESGQHGYVSFSYVPSNYYQRFGTLFIGLAPIIVGYLLVLLGMRFIEPDLYSNMMGIMNQGAGSSFFGLILSDIGVFFQTIWLVISNIQITIPFTLFVIITICVSSHITLSNADLSYMVPGLIMFLIILAIANLIIYFIFPAFFATFTSYFLLTGRFFVAAYSVSIFSFIVLFLFILLVSGLRYIFSRV